MAQIALRPDLKTAGGEVNDIVYNDQFVGTMTLVYRESDRLSGSVQLEEGTLSEREKKEVFAFLRKHAQAMVDALQAEECDIVVTYGAYDHIITSEEEDFDIEWAEEEDTRFDDVDPDERDEIEMYEADRQAHGFSYELVIVNESRNRIDYHVLDEDQELVAEVFLRIYGNDIVGSVEWRFDPLDEEMDHVTELIVNDFDENLVETFLLSMKYDDVIVDTLQLKRKDLIRGDETDSRGFNRDDYTIVLARDDGDTLTYEIYQQSRGGLPIGTATIDISQKQLTGFIDFRDPGSTDDREEIAALLMEELDKEKDYDSFNVTMMYQNEPIDEIFFESEQVH